MGIFKKNSSLIQTYSRMEVSMDHGMGCWLYDKNGKKYLDALSGIAVNTLGHSHPKFVSAITDQVQKLIHTSNLYQIPLQENLANELVKISNMDLAFFCNSGLEANETAIKIARKFGHSLGYSSPKIIVFEKSFHGRSIATISASSNPMMKKGFEPLLDGFIRVPLNDLEAINKNSAKHKEICAVFIETIQGEGGINIPEDSFIKKLRKICDENNWLLIMDEVQCGMGRTGKWFAFEWNNIKPDIVPLAKGLGSGIPVGAVLTSKNTGNLLGPGSHGTTFGGNPLAMRAGLETLSIVREENLLLNAQIRGKQLIKNLENILSGTNGVIDIRGRGLMVGIELHRSCKELAKVALNDGLLINVTESNIIRLLPPLIINSTEVNFLTDKLGSIIKNFLTNN
ncbi:MAG: aspartate aminotransferase family protein [Betaproteobacteria bacterium TMED156]|nr:MAG: aspartate aminotransferase family protein [Betaproteobacteria bacterium TMED156]